MRFGGTIKDWVVQHSRAFWNNQEGGLSVEYALWVPMMATGMVLTTDVAILMQEQSNLFVAARDASRMVALGYRSESEAKETIMSMLNAERSYTIGIETRNGFVTTAIDVPFSDVLIFGSVISGNATLSGKVSMLVEAQDGVAAKPGTEPQTAESTYTEDVFTEDVFLPDPVAVSP